MTHTHQGHFDQARIKEYEAKINEKIQKRQTEGTLPGVIGQMRVSLTPRTSLGHDREGQFTTMLFKYDVTIDGQPVDVGGNLALSSALNLVLDDIMNEEIARICPELAERFLS